MQTVEICVTVLSLELPIEALVNRVVFLGSTLLSKCNPKLLSNEDNLRKNGALGPTSPLGVFAGAPALGLQHQ